MSCEEREALIRLLRDVLGAAEYEIEYILEELDLPPSEDDVR